MKLSCLKVFKGREITDVVRASSVESNQASRRPFTFEHLAFLKLSNSLLRAAPNQAFTPNEWTPFKTKAHQLSPSVVQIFGWI
jgi:hypothetical protein